MKKFLLFLSLCVWTPVFGADAYQNYRNARYGYALDVPTFLIAKPEAENGDGRRFVSSDGKVLLRVFGASNSLNRSVSGQKWRATSDWRRDGARVTYSQSGANYYVLSGFVGGDIFYEKTVVWNGQFHTLIWEYPAPLKKRLDAPVTRSVRSFSPRNFRVSRVVTKQKTPIVAPTATAVKPQATPNNGY